MEWGNRLNSFTPIAMATYVPRRIINSCLVKRIKEFVVGIFSDFNDWLNSFDTIVNTRAMWCNDCANIHRGHSTKRPSHLNLFVLENNNNSSRNSPKHNREVVVEETVVTKNTVAVVED